MANIEYYATVRKRIEAIFQESADLQKQKLEDALTIAKDNFGDESPEFQKCAHKVCETCNLISIVFLQKENYDACFKFLKRAEFLAQNSDEFLAMTYNNLACFYNTTRKYRVSLDYLEKALHLENKLGHYQNISDIHLNICAVLSKLNRHEDGLANAMNSIILIQEEMLKEALPKLSEHREARNSPASDNQAQKPSLAKRLSILCIAYHNFAVELEHLNKYEQSLRAYKKAHEFASTYLGPEDQVTLKLKKVLEEAQVTIDEKLNKIKKGAGGNVPKPQGETVKEKRMKKLAEQREAEKNMGMTLGKKEFQIKNSALAAKKQNGLSQTQTQIPPVKDSFSRLPRANKSGGGQSRQTGGVGVGSGNGGVGNVGGQHRHGGSVGQSVGPIRDSSLQQARLGPGENNNHGQLNEALPREAQSGGQGADGYGGQGLDESRTGRKGWDGVLSGKGDDSDKGDDEMGDEGSGE